MQSPLRIGPCLLFSLTFLSFKFYVPITLKRTHLPKKCSRFFLLQVVVPAPPPSAAPTSSPIAMLILAPRSDDWLGIFAQEVFPDSLAQIWGFASCYHDTLYSSHEFPEAWSPAEGYRLRTQTLEMQSWSHSLTSQQTLGKLFIFSEHNIYIMSIITVPISYVYGDDQMKARA